MSGLPESNRRLGLDRRPSGELDLKKGWPVPTGRTLRRGRIFSRDNDNSEP